MISTILSNFYLAFPFLSNNGGKKLSKSDHHSILMGFSLPPQIVCLGEVFLYCKANFHQRHISPHTFLGMILRTTVDALYVLIVPHKKGKGTILHELDASNTLLSNYITEAKAFNSAQKK